MGKFFRVQKNVPSPYIEESRDFQALGRLYDVVINDVKFNVDSMECLTDTNQCRSDVLQLLQTKLGFFTNKVMEDVIVRDVLAAFPLMVKRKGSLKAIQEAINTFLKINGITTTVSIWYMTNAEVVYDTKISDHTIVICINKALENLCILDEIFRYILPTGFGFYFYFFDTVEELNTFNYDDNATLLFASDNINSQLRDKYYEDLDMNHLMNSLGTMEIASHDSLIPTKKGTYEPGDESKFKGILTELPTATDGDVVLHEVDGEYIPKVYHNNVWNVISIKGVRKELPSLSEVLPYSIYGIHSKDDRYYYDVDKWVSCKYRGKYKRTTDIPNPEKYDCAEILVDEEYKYFIYLAHWEEVENVIDILKVGDVSEPVDKTIAIAPFVTYYMVEDNTWKETRDAYMLIKNINTNNEEVKNVKKSNKPRVSRKRVSKTKNKK